MLAIWRELTQSDVRIVVPAPVVAEWWRGNSGLRLDILEGVDIEPLTEDLAKRAGDVLAQVATATVIDAIVMASAASRGDVVYTSDFDDLDRLHGYFRSVKRVLKV